MKLRPAIAPQTATPGDHSADSIDALYARHLSRVKRWARQLLGPGMDVQDLVHDVFCIAFRKPFQDRGEAAVDTWLFRITLREAQAKRRRQRLRQFLLGRHREQLMPAAPATPQQELERQEQHARLYRALDRLPDRYRTPLILFEIEELSGEQVAEIIQITEAALWVRLHRGRAKLLELLQEEERA